MPEALKKNQWRKGQSGNPNGIRKGVRSLTTLLRHYLQEPADKFSPIAELAEQFDLDPKKCIVGDVLVASMVIQGASGNANMMQTILRRIEGPESSVAPPPDDDLSEEFTDEEVRERAKRAFRRSEALSKNGKRNGRTRNRL